MLTVHVRVTDQASGKPVPVRLRISDPAGATYPPLGRLTDFSTAPGRDVGGQVLLAGQPFAYIDGACEVPLPPGPLRMQAFHGPEYLPLDREVVLAAGQMSLRLAMERRVDMRQEGWFAGDTRAVDLPPHAAALEGAAEGLAVVQLLAREQPGAISNLLAFSGTAAAVEAHGCLVAVNTLNTHPVLGSVALLNSHRPVFPLRFGGDRPDHWSVADWCDQCHRKTGLVVWPDLPRLRPDHPQGEALAALVLGKVDAFEVGPELASLSDYHRLLDAGLRPVLVGGSGKDSNAAVLGSMRTYAQLPPGQGLTTTGWIEAVRAGRTFITTGPLLSLSVAGEGPGAVRKVEPGERLRLRAEVRSAVPCERLELLVNGAVQAGTSSAVVECDLVCEESAWVAARCQAGGFAHTSPAFVEVAGRPRRPGKETIEPLLDVLAWTRAWVERRARCEAARQREHLLGVLDEARAVLEGPRGG